MRTRGTMTELIEYMLNSYKHRYELFKAIEQHVRYIYKHTYNNMNLPALDATIGGTMLCLVHVMHAIFTSSHFDMIF